MTFFEILDTIILKPLVLLFEAVYMMSSRVVEAPGISIIMLSLFVNLLALPLYMRADAIQEEEHAIEKKLQRGVDHIKKTFRGDERMMMLQTYYRQNNYKPVYVLRSAISLFLQIPFFIAAYRFLSGLSLLNGTSFGPISDLGSPDGMLQIGGVSINVLPIVMTAVNLVSCVIFTKGDSLKSKIQLYGMALFFMVFLYQSPSGLVFYWTLNNVFSLVKTVLYKMRDPGKFIRSICSGAGAALIIYGMFIYSYQYNSVRRKIFLAGVGILLQMPILYQLIKRKQKKRTVYSERSGKGFFAGTLFLTVLTGGLIPSAVIKASPQEFVEGTSFYHPLWFVVSSFCMAAGFFMLWVGVFYYLAKPSAKIYFGKAIWIFSGIAIVDYMFFGRNLGLLDAHLKLENELWYSGKEITINVAAVIMAALLLYVIYTKRTRFAAEVLIAGVLACSVMTAVNIAGISGAISKMDRVENEAELPELTLSRTGKNVIVLMLDRAMGGYMPYILNDKPELKKMFSGFTYYANMVSFGGSTNFGTPPLFGGYEYTPIEMNRRKTESLKEKHNESIKVLPVLFDQNGYEVTVCDPPYVNYDPVASLSIYDEYPTMKKYLTDGRFNDPVAAEQGIKNNKRNFFCYSIFKILPAGFQSLAYDNGRYNQTEMEIGYAGQFRSSLYTGEGMDVFFMSAYNVLDSFPKITKITDGETGTFLMMDNNTTHEPMLLQDPDYEPAMRVDNTGYAKKYEESFAIDGKTLKMETDTQIMHYQITVRALLELGEWFDYMRKENVYDNTKIIIVSDHGRNLHQLDGLIREDGLDIETYYALLLVKDFGSEGFEISEEFMTCADVPAIAVEDAIEEPVNPFTGKMLGYGDKATTPQYVIDSEHFNIYENNGNQFLPARWYTVQDDMRKLENWKLVAEDAILPLD